MPPPEVSLSTNSRKTEKAAPRLSQRPTAAAATRVLIVGGGASGTLLAIALLAAQTGPEVILVEYTGRLGRGLAYGAADENHVLNALPERMSAFECDQLHFRRWLHAKGLAAPDNDLVFAPRRLYGRYLEDALIHARSKVAPHKLTIIEGEVVDLDIGSEAVVATLATGERLCAEQCVLATGHTVEMSSAPPAPRPGAAALPTLILGTGLSMVDAFLSLTRDDPRARVVAVSRRGLIPQAHAHSRPAPGLPPTPIDLPVSQLMRWLRQQARQIGWRRAVDDLRPQVQEIWQTWSIQDRRRFLRHARAQWDVHRHRMDPVIHRRLLQARASGQLRVVAGWTGPVTPSAGPQRVSIRRRNASLNEEQLDVAEVIDCRGLARDWTSFHRSLIGKLIERGFARPDPLRIGLGVSARCEVLSRDGGTSGRLYAVGPLTRGTFFEIESVPEIRAQCHRLASTIVWQARHPQ